GSRCRCHVCGCGSGHSDGIGAYEVSYDNILVSRQGRVGTLTLNRPEKLNAFAGKMRSELADALDELDHDRAVRVIVITGAGRGFCAGADVTYMSELITSRDRENMMALVEAGRLVVTA